MRVFIWRVAMASLVDLLNKKMDEIVHLVASGKIELVTATSRIAIFSAKTSSGKIHVGWHYAPLDACAGDCVHYDHGAGITRNQDAQYIWVAPLTAAELQSIVDSPRAYNKRVIVGLFEFVNGRKEICSLKIDCDRFGLNPTFLLNAKSIKPTDLLKISSIAPIPSEALETWYLTDEHPEDGQVIVVWHNDKARENRDGPYWARGAFDATGKTNQLVPNYEGPMVSGEPWSSFKCWQSLELLFHITMGSEFVSMLASAKEAA
jgi:hypothetical protein